MNQSINELKHCYVLDMVLARYVNAQRSTCSASLSTKVLSGSFWCCMDDASKRLLGLKQTC